MHCSRLWWRRWGESLLWILGKFGFLSPKISRHFGWTSLSIWSRPQRVPLYPCLPVINYPFDYDNYVITANVIIQLQEERTLPDARVRFWRTKLCWNLLGFDHFPVALQCSPGLDSWQSDFILEMERHSYSLEEQEFPSCGSSCCRMQRDCPYLVKPMRQLIIQFKAT